MAPKLSDGKGPMRSPYGAAAHVIAGLQTVVSRLAELTRAPAVVSIGKIQGGVLNEYSPEEVEMVPDDFAPPV